MNGDRPVAAVQELDANQRFVIGMQNRFGSSPPAAHHVLSGCGQSNGCGSVRGVRMTRGSNTAVSSTGSDSVTNSSPHGSG